MVIGKKHQILFQLIFGICALILGDTEILENN